MNKQNLTDRRAMAIIRFDSVVLERGEKYEIGKPGLNIFVFGNTIQGGYRYDFHQLLY